MQVVPAHRARSLQLQPLVDAFLVVVMLALQSLNRLAAPEVAQADSTRFAMLKTFYFVVWEF